MPAFLVEIACYLAIAFDKVRNAFDGLGSKASRAAILATSALVPYVIVAVTTRTFDRAHLLMLAVVVLVAAFWYALIRPNIAADTGFLAIVGAVYLRKIFEPIYGQPAPHVPLAILGQLMWIRLSMMAVLSLRGIEEMRFGWMPRAKDWGIGAFYYLCFLPVGGGVAYLVRFAHLRAPALIWWKLALVIVGTFFAFLWVVALFEEFFFRGFLQRLLAKTLHNDIGGLIAASTIFGLMHLPYRAFPNWRFAIVAGVTGVFYGLAFLKAQSVRASMVTHALVVTTWRVFFSS